MKKRMTTALAGLSLAVPATLLAQRPTLEKPVLEPMVTRAQPVPLKFTASACCIKDAAQPLIVGLNNGVPVYKNARGEYFSVNAQTGDLKFLPADAFAQFHDVTERARSAQSVRMVKWNYIKYGGQVTILGVDPVGHVIHRNAQGTKFYLEPNTGDMVVVP
jgi:hypothetical protein